MRSDDAVPVTPSDATPEKPRPAGLEALRGAFAVQDLILLAYLAALDALLLGAPPGGARGRCIAGVSACIAVVLGGVVIARVARRVPELVRGLAYRLALLGGLIGSYMLLREIVPIVRPDDVDAQLFAIDLRLFGFEPSLALERYNHRPIVEWFSFFYFGYYLVIATFVVGVTFVGRQDRRATEFVIGTFLVYGLGHLGYLAVPGEGPHALLRDAFHGPVDGGVFWHLIWNAYRTSSASKDVFPSLHVGAPTWFTLYAIGRARSSPGWRKIAIAAAFVTSQIAVATLLLRWHYAIDLIAGVTLATAASRIAPALARREERRREERGLPPVWPALRARRL